MEKVVVGSYNVAKVYASIAEEEALNQIRDLCDKEWASDSHIAIMPDTHVGKDIVIGFTQKLNTENPRVNPNMVGCDVGCGMLVLKISKEAGDKIFNKQGLEKLDKVIHEKIPSGMKHRDKPLEKSKALKEELDSLICFSNES